MTRNVITCATLIPPNDTCSVYALTATDTTNFQNNLPSYSITNAGYAFNGNGGINLNMNIQTNDVDTFAISIYCDANANGILDNGEILLNTVNGVAGYNAFLVNDTCGNGLPLLLQIACTCQQNNAPVPFFSGPLGCPIQSFLGTKQHQYSQLTWEIDGACAGFQVERKDDYQDFEPIGNGINIPYDSNKQTYYLADLLPQVGKNIYRLKIIDVNGGYSCNNDKVELYFDEENIIGAVYPNPTNGDLYIPIGMTTVEDIQVMLYDIQGKELGKKWLHSENGLFMMNVSKLSNGVYILKISLPQKSAYLRFVKS